MPGHAPFRLTGAAMLAAAALCLPHAPALAHHSFAVFDRDKMLTLNGTIKEFEWTNPHSWIQIEVPNDKGVVEEWGIECNSPNNLARQGWKSTSLKPGDKVSVVIHPMRTGEKGGSFVSVTLPDGKQLVEPSARQSGL